MGVYGTGRYGTATYGTPATVELLLDGVWTDITTYCQLPVTITRGRQDEASSPQTATCTVTVDNSDGRFSPKNSSGAYWPDLGLGTQLRVTVGTHVRFVGALYEYPQALAPDTEDARYSVQLVANGPRRRLARNTALQSPYRRAMDRITVTTVIDYWPMEDGAQSSWFANAIPGGTVGSFSGSDPTLAADSTWAASSPLPTPGDDGDFVFPVRSYTPSTETAIRLLMSATDPGASLHTLVVQARTVNGGNHMIEYAFDPHDTTWTVSLKNQASGSTESTTTTGSGFPVGKQRVMLAAKQSGSDIAWSVTTLEPGDTSGLNVSGTFTAATLGQFSQVELFNGTSVTTTYGHLSVETAASFDIFDIDDALDGYAGETAYTRVARLSDEEGITLERPSVVSSVKIGPQGESTYLALLDEAADVDYGLSTETVDAFGLTWRGRTSMQGSVDLVLARTDLMALTATYDDESITNDVTVTRPLGSSERVVSDADAVGVTDAGTFATQVNLNLYQDADLDDAANARLAAGTMDEVRVPTVVFDARNSSVDAADLAAMREGDTVELTGWDGDEGIAADVTYWLLGWSETVDESRWLFELNLVPDPHARVFVLDDTVLGVLDVDRLGY